MPITYKNRKGQIWHLYEGITKTGKPKFFLSQKPADGTRVTKIPEGHEIYEKPNGQVFCRKQLPVLITDDEVKLVEKELAKHKLTKRRAWMEVAKSPGSTASIRACSPHSPRSPGTTSRS